MGRSNCEPDSGAAAKDPKSAKTAIRKQATPAPKPGQAKPTVFAGQQSKPGNDTESSPQEYAALKTRILDVLRSPECRMISFAAGRFIVSGRGYAVVADAVDKGVIKIAIGAHAGYEASYTPATRTFEFPHLNYGVKRTERASIVHEATHAVIDIYWKMNAANGTALASADEEPIAYLAGSVFYELNVRGGASFMGPMASSSTGAIERQADLIAGRIALDLLNSNNRLLVAIPQVTPKELSVLSHYIATHPEY